MSVTVAVHIVLDVVERLGDHLVGVTRIAGDAGHGQGGPLPGVVMIHFRDGDLEALAEFGLEAPQDVALPLSEPTSGRCSSTLPTATRAADMLEGPRDLFRGKGLDDVAGLDALDALDADAALEPLQHLAHSRP